jgi:site-specific DNA recombinase
MWLAELCSGKVASIADIAAREQIGERHVQRRLQLACLSPNLIAAIADGVAPANLTVTGLTADLCHRWSEQEFLLRRA